MNFIKIMRGIGDYLFFGIINENKNGFHRFSILDLDVFRDHFGDKTVKANLHEMVDGTIFLSFKYEWFPKELIVKQKFEGEKQ